MDAHQSDDNAGVVFGIRLEEDGTRRDATLRDAVPGAFADGFTWVNLDRESLEAREWVSRDSGVDAMCAETLYADDTRPRTLHRGTGLLVNLRGVNLNPGADPDDMVSLRLWVEEHRMISIRGNRLMALQDVRDQIETNGKPNRAGAVLVELADALIDRLSIVLEDIEEVLVSLEELHEPSRDGEDRRKLATLRRAAIRIRRYLAPQRDALNRLSNESLAWLKDSDKLRLRETADRVTRYVEDLDSVRERAAVVQDEWATRQAERMNNTMYILSIVAAIFLPLGLLTGLLGINVGGIPLADNSNGFLWVSIGLILIAACMAYVFRRAKWF